MQDLMPLLLRHGPLLVFLVTLAARVGAPVPAAPLLVVAGGLGALGQMPLAATVALALLANMLGDIVWFVAGRKHGWRVLGLLCRISLSPDSCVRQSQDLFDRWGGLSLVAAKFVPGVSLIATPMAGALQMGWGRFLSWNLLAAAAWTAAFMALGALFRSQIDKGLEILADAGVKALLLLVVGVAMMAALRWIRRRRAAAFRAGRLIAAHELADALTRDEPLVVLDVRGSVAREATGGVPGARAAEAAHAERAVGDVSLQTPIVTYCACPNDASAVVAARALHARGYTNVRVLAGGFDAWHGWASKQETGFTIPPSRTFVQASQSGPHWR